LRTSQIYKSFLTVGLSQARSLSLVLLLSFHSLKELFYLSPSRLRHSRVTSLSKAGAKVLQFSLSSKYFCNFFEKFFIPPQVAHFQISFAAFHFALLAASLGHRIPLVFFRKGCKDTLFYLSLPNFSTTIFKENYKSLSLKSLQNPKIRTILEAAR
ncbi:MAG: hypothetical protein IIX13_04545, partial [Bacteroidales bacterium]|nr:hypothetical protein [Bacteroidales bacterium]